MADRVKPSFRTANNSRLGVYLDTETRRHYINEADELLHQVREAVDEPVSGFEAERLQLKLGLAREYRELAGFNTNL